MTRLFEHKIQKSEVIASGRSDKSTSMGAPDLKVSGASGHLIESQSPCGTISILGSNLKCSRPLAPEKAKVVAPSVSLLAHS